jgi:hypothetical protein
VRVTGVTGSEWVGDTWRKEIRGDMNDVSDWPQPTISVLNGVSDWPQPPGSV